MIGVDPVDGCYPTFQLKLANLMEKIFYLARTFDFAQTEVLIYAASTRVLIYSELTLVRTAWYNTLVHVVIQRCSLYLPV